MQKTLELRLHFKAVLIVIVSTIVFADQSIVDRKPQDCTWSAWVDYGCSGTCGEHGMRTKKRIKLQEAANGGRNCRGATTRNMPCNLSECENLKIPDDFTYPNNLDKTVFEYVEEPEEGFEDGSGLKPGEESDNLASVPVTNEVLCGNYSSGIRVSSEDVNCAAHGDINSYCVYGHHCGCGLGYVCEEPLDRNHDSSNECATGAVCVPDLTEKDIGTGKEEMDTGRSNARIDYDLYPETDGDLTNQEISNQTRDALLEQLSKIETKVSTIEEYLNKDVEQRIGKDLKVHTNSCSPNCKSCKSITTRTTDEWCLLECNNPGASRCLTSWCECY